MKTMTSRIRGLAAAGLLAAAATVSAAPAMAETIKVGILHSLSGTMAISETTLKDVMLMLIEEQTSTKAAACSAGSSRRWSSTRPPTGRYSPRKPAN